MRSRLSPKSQVTIPMEVRKILKLQPGDEVIYDVSGDSVKLRKARTLDLEFLRSQESQLAEWNDGLDDGL